jgi:hypothetical protein
MVRQLSLHIWHDIAFSKLKKRLVKAIIHIYHAARSDRSECFEYGDYIATTVQVRCQTVLLLRLVKNWDCKYEYYACRHTSV